MGALAGQHALVTGGGTGIGAAIARALGDAGAAVTVAGRRKAPLEAVAASLPKGAAAVADVTREADCAAMVEAARAAHGPLDIVIANAGLAESAPFGKIRSRPLAARARRQSHRRLSHGQSRARRRHARAGRGQRAVSSSLRRPPA